MSSRTGRAVAVVRILTGIIFVAEGVSKITGDFVRGGFAEDVREIAAERSWPFWKSFLESVVLPNAGPFGWFFALAELALGIGLVLGLFTRVAAICGVLLMAILLLGQTYLPGASWDRWITSALSSKFGLLLLWMLYVTDAGRVWGLDSRRSRAARRF